MGRYSMWTRQAHMGVGIGQTISGKHLMFLVLVVIYIVFRFASSQFYIWSMSESTAPLHSGHISLARKLLWKPNENITSGNQTKSLCTHPSISEFPRDVFHQQQRQHGAILLHVFVALYMFLALAYLCDDYFVSSLDKICERMNLSEDVAGATFMAAGSSAPELFTSLIGVFITKGDVGVGTIVGSAVFNVLIILALCGLFAGRVVYLTAWPLFRESGFYAVSVAALIWVIYDGFVTWYESIVMLLIYAAYIVVMKFNPIIVKKIDEFKASRPRSSSSTSLIADSEAKKTNGTFLYLRDKENNIPGMATKTETVAGTNIPEIAVEGRTLGVLLRRTIWLISLPLVAIFFITIPDCRKPRWQTWYLLTFFMTVVWMMLLSYVLVWMVSVIGYTLGIPDVIMGITFLAAGTSIPDAIASLLVSKQGMGDMAVSNSIGSNVFDILVGLALPWFLQSAIVKPGSKIAINSRGLIYSVWVLFGSVFLTVFAIHCNRWRLTRPLGLILVVAYFVVVILSSLIEFNVFAFVNYPVCEYNG